MKLPEGTSISIAKTTMKDALGATGYTHGTTIFLRDTIFEQYTSDEEYEELLAHELFHCLTRNNPDFRKDRYSFIHFTVIGADFAMPKNVREQMILNPDVGHHDSYATFTINGEKKDCYLVFLAKDDFEKPGGIHSSKACIQVL